MEGICKTENGAALTIIAVPPGQDCAANAGGIAVPNGLSAMSDLDPNGQIKGLDQEPDTSLWPPVATIFVGFHLMVAVGSLMLMLMLIGVFFLWRRSVETRRWWLRAAVLGDSAADPGHRASAGWLPRSAGSRGSFRG